MIFFNVKVYNVPVFIVLLFYTKVTFTRELSKRASRNNVDNNMQHTFAKLLKTIVRVNEERMNAVKQISELQDYMLTKNKLRTDDDSYDSLEDDDNSVFLALGEPPKRRTVYDKITRDTCNKIFLNNNNIGLTRRQFMKQACRDQSIDICVNVCSKTVANLCNTFSCITKVDNNIRTECQKNCRDILAYEEG